MKDTKLFASAIGIKAPWYIKEIEFKGRGRKKELHIYLDHENGTKFNYEGTDYPVYDHQEREWEHLRFFEHHSYLHAPVPRIKNKEGKVKLVQVPWALSGSSFTIKFEYDILDLVEEGMSCRGVARRLDIGDKRVSAIIRRHVSHGLATQGIKVVRELSVDETSTRKGHNYFTIMSDRKEKKVVGVAVGKDKTAWYNALVDMEIRGGDRNRVRSVTMDMSGAYISAADETMEQADIVFDRFHIVKKLNEAVDQIRKQDQQEHVELKKTRYLWLKNSNKLTDEQLEQVNSLSEVYQNIGEAYRLKELLKVVLDDAYHSNLLKPLNDWMKEAWQSELEPIQEFVNMLKRHWYGIKTYFKRVVTNAYAERVNLKIQEIKRIAKGYRNTHNFMMMIYFHLGGLKLKNH